MNKKGDLWKELVIIIIIAVIFGAIAYGMWELLFK